MTSRSWLSSREMLVRKLSSSLAACSELRPWSRSLVSSMTINNLYLRESWEHLWRSFGHFSHVADHPASFHGQNIHPTPARIVAPTKISSCIAVSVEIAEADGFHFAAFPSLIIYASHDTLYRNALCKNELTDFIMAQVGKLRLTTKAKIHKKQPIFHRTQWATDM